MQGYKKIPISKDEVVSVAEKMRAKGITLSMIHAYLDEEGKGHVSYEYEINPDIESYTVEGENVLPTISHIYDLAAEWPEREIMELMDITFEGVDTSKRLFMPDTMLSGQGQILVTPMDELIDMTQNGEKPGQESEPKQEQNPEQESEPVQNQNPEQNPKEDQEKEG